MRGTRVRFFGLFLVTAALAFAMVISGLAQEATLTPSAPDTEAEPTEVAAEAGVAATSEITATATITTTASITAPLSVEATTVMTTTPDVITAITATATVTTTAAVEAIAEITATTGITIAEVAEPAIVLTVTSEITTTVDVVGEAEPEADEGAELVPDALPARVLAEESKSVELTVYNQDLGLVKEVRTLDLEKGLNEVRYVNVASRIEPTSVHFRPISDPENTFVIEQNYEYDLVSSEKLLQKYVDLPIALRTQEGQVYTGTLLSGVGDVILATADGIRVVRLAQIQEFSFPELPEGLITKPTLVWLVEAAEAGKQDVRITYLTNGINWQADYIAVLDEDDESLSINGWMTVDNRSGASYRDAKLKLVAGDIHRVVQAEFDFKRLEIALPRLAAVPEVEERAFFEYHIYEVSRPVTVRDRQTKQIQFVTAPEVKADKVLVYEASPRLFVRAGGAITDPSYGAGSNAKVQVLIEFSNSKEGGLGIPLPKGTVRVYKEDVDGGAELVGEDEIDHTPKDEQVSLYLGDAFDIVAERVQSEFRQLSDSSLEETFEITLRNHKDEDVVVRVIEHLYRAHDAEIVESSAEYEMTSATTARYEVEVEAGGEAQITYAVLYRW